MTDAPQQARRFCKRCDYDLSASDGPVCPECGRAFSQGDPRTYWPYPRRSLKARWRRWRWFIVPVFLLAAVWPKGWVRIKATWVDPATGGTVASDSLLIAHPWWTGGWYAPIGRTTQSADTPFAAPPSTAQNVRLVIDLWRCDSAMPWRYDPVGTGQIAVAPPAPETLLTPAEWTLMIRRYTRTVADDTGNESASMGGMSFRVYDPPWTTVLDSAR